MGIPRQPEIAVRRAKVMAMVREGQPHRKIARTLKITRNLVKQDVWQVRRNAAPVAGGTT
jgi:DNA-binding CsgD family transcriptional regulator